ncbi:MULTISPECIES: helix-turn-helix transcriptional regulator [unclassified Mycobacterium]|uniref:helix-turn-helix transcriptional regulator n=1 Tax=unclassified Mycobacterium TaxID=2642494 RepID=UPI0029C99B24|nr:MULTISPECIES: AAA family ATPase [unclassified Mycobacterium]
MAQTLLRGRSEAMSQALSALRRAARTGQGALVVISGEPGIGKSAVLRAVVEQAGRSGFIVGSGKAEHGDQIAPGAPLLVSLRSGPQPLLPGDAFASLAPLYDKPLWLVDRIGALLEELAATAPVLVAIDDLQWADRLTRFALRVLPARLSGSPVVWLVTSRWAPRAALDEVIAGTDDSTTITRIALDPLAPNDIDELASDRLGAEPAAQLRTLLGGVGGNPFWAVQVIDGWTRRRERRQHVGDLSAELSVGVRARLDALSAQGAALTRLAAVWGRALSMPDAGILLGDVSDAQVRILAREGVDNGLLGSAEGAVFFPHDLVREAVYADIAPADRRALHRACARYVVGDGGSALAAAAHFRASAVQDDEEAIVALEEAARECLVSMPDQAAELAQQAFALSSPGRPLWFVAGIRTVETQVNAQHDRQALVVADRLLAVASEAELIARIELQACRALWCVGECEQMERRSSASMSQPGVSAVSRAQLASARALAATRTQSPAVAAAMADDALAEGRRLGDFYSQRLAVVALIENARNEGRHRLALDRFTDLRRLSDSAYQAEEIRTLQHLDHYDDAEAMLIKIREASDDVDKALPSMLYAQMWQDHNLARLDAAEAGASTLLTLADETGNHRYRLSAQMVLAAAAMHRGEHPRVAEVLASVEDDAPHEGSVPSLRLMQGWLKAGTGDAGAGLAMLEPLLDGAAEFRDPWPWSPPWMRTLARIGLDAGNQALAHKAAAIADLVAQRNPGVATLDGTALHIHGLIADDAGLLGDAVRTLRESPRPLLLADALKDLGATLLKQDQPTAGADALLEASELYQSIGASASVRSIANLLRRQGIRGVRIPQAAARPQTGWAALTPTELRVVELISAGHANRSAAAELGVSPNTVNTHMRAVFKKLDVKSRVQLTIAFQEYSAGGGPTGQD